MNKNKEYSFGLDFVSDMLKNTRDATALNLILSFTPDGEEKEMVYKLFMSFQKHGIPLDVALNVLKDAVMGDEVQENEP